MLSCEFGLHILVFSNRALMRRLDENDVKRNAFWEIEISIRMSFLLLFSTRSLISSGLPLDWIAKKSIIFNRSLWLSVWMVIFFYPPPTWHERLLALCSFVGLQTCCWSSAKTVGGRSIVSQEPIAYFCAQVRQLILLGQAAEEGGKLICSHNKCMNKLQPYLQS